MVLLDSVLGRQRGDCVLMGLLRRRLVQVLSPQWHGELGIAMIGLWIPAIINLSGVRQMAWFQNVTVVLKFLPLLFVVSSAGFCREGQLWTLQRLRWQSLQRIGIAAGVALFSFIGVEAAAITAKRVKDPRTNVLRRRSSAPWRVRHCTFSSRPSSWVRSHHTLVNTGSPFGTPFNDVPHSAWAGQFVAGVAVISGLGALIAWTLIVTETSRAIAQDDLFPRPFAWSDKRGTAWFGILVGTALRHC